MIQIHSDPKELVELGRKMLKLRDDLTFEQNQAALRYAVRPVYSSMVSKTPVGKGGYRIGRRGVAGANKSSLEYRRGGATKADTRIKSLRMTKQREAVVLVGVSRKRGYVGWRTHFLLHGTKKMRRNDYMLNALNENLGKVPDRYEEKARKIINKHLAK